MIYETIGIKINRDTNQFNFNTIIVILSLEPFYMASFISRRLRESASVYYFIVLIIFWMGKKSHNPSLAMIRNLWGILISIFTTSGVAINPIFLSEKSPNALVTARTPHSLFWRILPPLSLSYNDLYLLDPFFLLRMICSMFPNKSITIIITEYVCWAISNVC